MVLQRKREGSGNYVQSYGKMRDETAAEQNIKTLLVSVKNLMKNMNLSPEQAMDAMGISEDDRKMLLQRI